MPLGKPTRLNLMADTPVDVGTAVGLQDGESYLFQALDRIVYLREQPDADADPTIASPARRISPDEFGDLPGLTVQAGTTVWAWCRHFAGRLNVLDEA